MEALTEDGKVTKRIIQEGFGATPKKKSEVAVHFDAYIAKGDAKFDSSRDRKVAFTFKLKDGKVIEAWEIAIPTMKPGEIAEICCSYEYGYGEKGSYPLVPPKADLRFVVELLESWEPAHTAKQRIEAATIKKNEGNEFMAKQNYSTALYAYKRARQYIVDLWDCEPEETVKCRQLMIAIQGNITLCHLKLKDWSAAIESGKRVLDRDPHNVKACYRMAQATLANSQYELGLEFVQNGLKIHPTDENLLQIKDALEAKLKKYEDDSKKIYRKMIS
ncbi:hypothetical protein BX666DRAFT_2032247 [Dichotomocladium elegans]|nr:hypothetical protein BX666DRAFT_2032247 [Dichotomocladium elegans]